MKRSLILITVLALSLVAVPAAGAVVPRKLNAGAKWGFTTGNGYAYWIKDGRRVMRTDLATNAVSQLAAFPPHRSVWSMHAGGGFVTLSIYSKKSGVSEIRRIDSAGGSIILARAKFHRKSKRHCGTFVVDGPITDLGESTWQRWSERPARKRDMCDNADLTTKLTARTFRRQVGGSAEQMLPPVTRSIVDMGTDGLLSDSRVPQVEERFALVVLSATRLNLVDRTSGKVIFRTGPDDVARANTGSLAPDGSLIFDTYSDITDSSSSETVPKLVTRAGLRRNLTPNYPKAEDTRSIFCGRQIVQIDAWTARGDDGDETRFGVWTRGLDGANPTQIANETELPHLNPSRIECDGNLLAMELESEDVRGSFRYVLDLP